MSYKEIGNLRKMLIDSLAQFSAPLGVSYHCEEFLTSLAQQAGVQPNELLVLAETDAKGEVSAVIGLKDPHPSVEQSGDLISYKHSVTRAWTPANQPRYGRPPSEGDAVEDRLNMLRQRTAELPDDPEERLNRLREISAEADAHAAANS